MKRLKKVKVPRYTINQFRKEFPNDDVCLDKIFELRYSKVPCCPQCSQQTAFKRIEGRRAYQCSDKDCQYQLYPTAGTVFEKTRTSLKDWFYAMYLMTSTRNGVSAKEIERQVGVTYKTAWRMGHCIRALMQSSGNILSGVIEIDETYIGGTITNKSKKVRDDHKKNNTQWLKKTGVIGILQRNGEIITQVLDTNRPSSEDLIPIIKDNVSPNSIINTDGLQAYKQLKNDYQHEIVNHEKDEFVRGEFHTNSIEGFFSHLKRTIRGTHIQVSRKYLQAYANECSFRYVHREEGQKMFYSILDRIV